MSIPDDLQYTSHDEWVRVDGDVISVGITAYAQDQLGELVHVELPDVGATFAAQDVVCEIESVKAVADLNTPIAGTVAEVNVAIEEHLQILSTDPFNEGWMVKIAPKTKGLTAKDLMDAAAYEEFLAAKEH